MFRSPKDVKVRKLEVVTKKSTKEEYYCDLCELGPWPNELDLRIHRKSNHKWYLINALKDESGNMCSICLREEKDRPTLIEHILQHHLCSPGNATRINREIFICDHCHRLFFNKQLLICHMHHWHIRKSKQKEVLKLNCPKCWKIIAAKSAWFHLLYHGAFSIGTCPICLKICDNSMDMVEHIKTHKGYFLCCICGYETTKEFYYNNHMDKHKKNVECDIDVDVTRFFLPQKMYPSLKNRMNHVFKGIPLTNEISICILCRTLCMSKREMAQHIYGDHAPEEKVKSKTYFCVCGEQFFNNVLLKHHIFKLKGDHRVCDVESLTDQVSPDQENVVYQIFEISDPLSVNMNEIIITGLSGHAIPEVVPHVSGENRLIIQDFEEMES